MISTMRRKSARAASPSIFATSNMKPTPVTMRMWIARGTAITSRT